MRPFHTLPAATALAAILAATVPAQAGQQAPLNIKFSQSSRNGVCYVGFEGGNAPGTDKPMTLEFSYRVRDGNFGATVKVNGWPKAQAEAARGDEKPIPMTLKFDTGKTTTSRSGGWESGFDDDAWGGWGAGPTSDAAFPMLRDAKTASVTFDGLDLGSFNLQMKSLAHVSLEDCAKRVKEGKE